MRLMLFVTLVVSSLAALANGQASTQTEITIAGFDIARFGGPVGTLSLRTTILGTALDLEPAPEFGLYAAAARITFNGVSEDSEGWLQLRNRPNEDALIFTVRFPGETLPGQALNTAISGIDLQFTDPSGAMLTSTDPFDIPADFAARFETFSYALRIGGWLAGEGEWQDFTGDSAASASFLSSSIQVAAVPAPTPILAMLSAVSVLAVKRRRTAVAAATLLAVSAIQAAQPVRAPVLDAAVSPAAQCLADIDGPARSGCCSHHDGVCGCSSSGKAQCCDGAESPSCGCNQPDEETSL